MTDDEIAGLLDFLRMAERLKGTLRTGHGSDPPMVSSGPMPFSSAAARTTGLNEEPG